MPTLATLLDAPITWMDAATDSSVKALLDDMQANILKGHGRHFAAHMFLSFAGMTAGRRRGRGAHAGPHCTSAYHQLRGNRRYPPHLDGGTVRCLFLSASGYKRPGPWRQDAHGDAFQAGMGLRAAT